MAEPIKILHRYSSLRRELALDGPQFAPELLNEVLPVVVLHEHCEQAHEQFAWNSVGVLAAGQIGATLPRQAGAVQISGTLSGALAVALVGAHKRLFVDHVSGGEVMALAQISLHGTETVNAQFIIPKLHIVEGDFIQARLGDALLVNDVISGIVVVQAI